MSSLSVARTTTGSSTRAARGTTAGTAATQHAASVTKNTVSNATSAAATATKAASTPNAAKIFRQWQVLDYPLQLWWFVASLIGFAMLLYVGSLVVRYMRRRKDLKTYNAVGEIKNGEVVQSGRQDVSSWRHLGSAISSTWKVVLYRCTIPISLDHNQRMNIAEIFFSVAYLVACLTWAYALSNGPSDYGDRDAWLALCQLPLVVGLAGKNNVISFITGIGPEKLNILHRSAGRTLLILGYTHALGRYSIGLNGAHAIYQPIMIWGVTALSCFTLTTILGFRWIRTRFYEFFLVSHIVLIFFFLLGAYYHKPSDNYWVFPAFALWATDRVVRFLRLFVLNRLWFSFIPWTAPNASTRATVEALSDCTLRIRMRRHMSWSAGQHVYLIVPGVSRLPWEAHPFTIASVPVAKDQKVEGEQNSGNELMFLVRARDGLTKRLMARAVSGGGVDTVTAFIDGPYGCPPALRDYTTVVLIAGGSGISYTLAQLSRLVQFHRTSASVVRRISFVWIIRHTTHISWIAVALLEIMQSVPEGLEVQIQIHITHTGSMSNVAALLGPDGEKAIASPVRTSSFASIKSAESATASEDGVQATEGQASALLRLTQVRLGNGRPDLPALLREEIEASNGFVSVDVCGPTSLSRSVRNALTKKDIVGFAAVMKGKAQVDLHVETFGW